MKLNRDQYIIREKSILTNGEVEELSSIKNFPVFIGATSQDKELDIFHDLTFDICKETGLIQNRYFVDPNILYSQFHSEAIGNVWEQHHKIFSELILKYHNNNNILEIGGSDSRLALNVLNSNNNIKKWTILEPNIKEKLSIDKLNYIDGFFDKNFINPEKFDMIVSSQVIEHAIDPGEFLKTISSILDYGEYNIFACPYFDKYLINRYVNAINFEHTLFLTEEIMDYLLSYYEFKIIEKYHHLNHSIFYVTQKQKTLPLNLPNKYLYYKQMYLDFFNYYTKFVEDLNIKLQTTTKDVYLFGGHVFSQYLIALGLNVSKIICILDNSELKKEKRLYGSNLIIKSPYDVKLDENSLIILKVGQYKDEIKNQLLNINKKITFYE